MKDIVVTSILFMFGLVSGVLNIVTGFICNNVLDLTLGYINIFLSGALMLILYVEIKIYRLD